MTTPDIEPAPKIEPEQPIEAEAVDAMENAAGTMDAEEEEDERRRRKLLFLLILLLVVLCCVCGVIARYLLKPQPLPEMILPTQVGGLCYAPTYKFSIDNVDGPVAVAVSPNNERIYVAEGAGERLVKVFDFNGNLLFSFAPPGTDKANREPKYMAIGPDGRIYLVDRTSSAIDIYDPEGNLIDAIIGQKMTLTKYLAAELKTLPPGTRILHYEGINKVLTYQVPGKDPESIKIEFKKDEPQWSPLGLRFDNEGNLLYSDTTETLHNISIIPANDLSRDLSKFNPNIKSFGSQGTGNEQFDFPQTAVVDGEGNYYVSDGNNARISIWTPNMKYVTFFGFGSTTNGALNMPRGTWMGPRGCLLVADAVGSLIRVYDVSGEEPALAYEIGGYGIAEGQFNYPIDVVIDGTGRLYVADRANNRIQVWSY